MRFLAAFFLVVIASMPTEAFALSREKLAELVIPPYALGQQIEEPGVYRLLNSGGAPAGYVFETEPLAPLPGFSGATINVLVTLDNEGRFLDTRLISHNEPIFVSGLGEEPFKVFFEQYRGHSIFSQLAIGDPRRSGKRGGLVYLDGVTKATASVRIAHESILAATLAVARQKMRAVTAHAPARPDPDHREELTWDDLVEQGIARRTRISNSEVQANFAGTRWEDDDPQAASDPDAAYLDLWVVDVGPPSIARAALAASSVAGLREFASHSPHHEPILLIEAGRHGLVDDDFVRNTAPERIALTQDGLPIPVRDTDILVEIAAGAPDGVAMILSTDRRLGFDPAREWQLDILVVREHGMFQPEIGSVALPVAHATDSRFFIVGAAAQTPPPPWLGAIHERAVGLVALTAFMTALLIMLGGFMNRFTALAAFPALRLAILAVMTVLIGWWGQGQLSIITPLAALRALLDARSPAFLLYDPFSLAVWAVAIAGAAIWGRGLFCGWLCPFGALQEFCHHIGRVLGVRQIQPSALLDAALKKVKYVVLAALVAVTVWMPGHLDRAVEVEPFKTAISVFFVREWYYVVYAALCLISGMVVFRGYCRYLCPLGALVALTALVRRWAWIERRDECGSPCQLCAKRCLYNAIGKTGRVTYSECFQCLDCVRIHNDPRTCVPLVLAARARKPLTPQPVASRSS